MYTSTTFKSNVEKNELNDISLFNVLLFKESMFCFIAVKAPKPLKNRDFVIQRSWLDMGIEYFIINHSVNHQVCILRPDLIGWFFCFLLRLHPRYVTFTFAKTFFLNSYLQLYNWFVVSQIFPKLNLMGWER